MFRCAAAALLRCATCFRSPPLPTRHIFIATTSLHSRTINYSTTSEEDPEKSRGPPPIRVSVTDSAGRGVFATRRIRTGEIMHTAQPLVAHPSASLLHEVCYYCLRRLGGGSGSDDGDGGDRVRFCSERCREDSKVFYEVEKRADWSAFDDYCRARKLKYPFLVKRLACMVVCGTTSATTFDILQPAILSSDVMLQMDKEFELLRSALLKIQLEDKYTAFLTKNWYVGVLARIHINAFRIDLTGGSYEDLVYLAAASVASEAAIGNAVYMFPSFYNHDCDPNAHIIWIDNVDAKLKALRDIESDEELRICYIDASMDRDARQRILCEGFGFQCNCSRCMSGD